MDKDVALSRPPDTGPATPRSYTVPAIADSSIYQDQDQALPVSQATYSNPPPFADETPNTCNKCAAPRRQIPFTNRVQTTPPQESKAHSDQTHSDRPHD